MLFVVLKPQTYVASIVHEQYECLTLYLNHTRLSPSSVNRVSQKKHEFSYRIR